MGTPDFAVASLQTLVENGCEVVGVITATDKPAGRGNKLRASAVKEYALSQGLTVLQPPNLKSKKFLKTLEALKADIQVVVAFRMLPAVVFDMPPMGTFNLHASLLPQYRGAAPINWAVINGEKESGVTTFFIEQQIDTGKIIFQEKVPIGEEMSAGDLHDELMKIGAGLVLKTVKALESGDYPQIDQVLAEEMKDAPKIYKETCAIDWEKTTEEVYNQIRGLSPYPAAFTFINEERFKIFKTEKLKHHHNVAVGSFITDHKTFLNVATKDGFLSIKELQMAGKRKMLIEDFLKGYRFA